jgi:hypothetical protein
MRIGPKVETSSRLIELSLPSVKVPEGMTYISSSVVDLLPWVSPSIVATVGGPGLPGDGGTQVLISYEWPVPYFNAISLMGKAALESLHVARFQADAQLATGELPFTLSGRGAEPPDFLVNFGRGEVGLECTALTDLRRRRVEGLFSRIRARLLREPRESWQRIAGHVIVAWFVDEDSLTPDQLPHKGTDLPAIDALVEKLRGLTPGEAGQAVGQPSDYIRELQEMGVVSSGYGCLFYALPMHEATPATEFFARTGFEFACLYESLHTATTIVSELDRLVRQHDRAGVDVLLITVAGPRRDGLFHPSEMVLGNTFIQSDLPIARPRYIRRVLLHLFPIGGCYEAFPRRDWWISPQYRGGLVTAHHKRPAAEPVQVTMNPP